VQFAVLLLSKERHASARTFEGLVAATQPEAGVREIFFDCKLVCKEKIQCKPWNNQQTNVQDQGESGEIERIETNTDKQPSRRT
jgi:hypothetical protein